MKKILLRGGGKNNRISSAAQNLSLSLSLSKSNGSYLFPQKLHQIKKGV
jgi:hypothetical protein